MATSWPAAGSFGNRATSRLDKLRARLASDGELLGGVSRELATAVQDFYRRRFEQLGVRGGKTGSVTMVQRANADLRLNPHYHQIALGGVYTETENDNADETPLFHPLPHLTSQDVADLLQVARARILRFLRRQGAVVETSPLEVSDAGAAAAEKSLQQLAVAAVTGQVPAGPELREREPMLPAHHNVSARGSPNG